MPEAWTVDLIYSVSILVAAASQQVFLHLELEAAVLPKQKGVLAGVVLCGQQGRLALLRDVLGEGAQHLGSPFLGELGEHIVFREELVVESLGSRNPLQGVFLQQSLKQVEPWVRKGIHVSGRFE